MQSIHRFFFEDKRMSWLWLVVRLYLGWEWLYAGYEKIINPVWVGSTAGGAITGFVNGALAKTTGAHPDVQMWYAWFLNHAVLPSPAVWSHIVAYGELLVGLGLIFGALTFLSAFFGFFMNINYLLAGTVSSNPILLILALLIMLAHKTAGWIGLDYFWKKRFDKV
ncbi:MAG TPA: DoxX family membrane protein [Candidatus Paceibacterota bacterium]